VSSVVMTGKVNNRQGSASNFKATGWTVWCEVAGTTAEGITGRLKTNINLNYI